MSRTYERSKQKVVGKRTNTEQDMATVKPVDQKLTSMQAHLLFSFSESVFVTGGFGIGNDGSIGFRDELLGGTAGRPTAGTESAVTLLLIFVVPLVRCTTDLGVSYIAPDN
jgi:hypothetical protein